MDISLRKRIVQFMDKCRVCTIATANPQGQPSASTVFFRNVELDIYFNTAMDSQKVRDITANHRVALTMQEPGSVPAADQDIKGIQYVGEATILPDGQTTGVPRGVVSRHKAFNSAMPGKSVIVKVTPLKVYFIDYSRGFRHRDLLDL
jgi:nitroimidazol reductase NimA-like FMN-containing flavoprotein (pyridoxamine 5'-phosphate oxidase superfamily)